MAMANDKLRFNGRVVVVTGAGAGLGRAYALLFASRGAYVVVNDLGGSTHGDGSSTKVADTVVNEIKQAGGRAVANYDNVLEGHKIVKTAIDNFGRIDILINNAGILRDKSFINMSENDWDIIYSVHLKGAMKTTHAAWPYFRKQKYGRVIMTSSNSGLYGNFGQANYSAAKLGLVGFANTLALEGTKNNIHTNVLVPTAGSRLTEDILPPDLFNQLKPELIAPIVMWLCHEDCTENGSIIESAVGWAGRCRLYRSQGAVLRKNLEDMVTPEAVRAKWSEVTDMANAKPYDSIQDVTSELMNAIEQLKNGGKVSEKELVVRNSYTLRDAILYALGVGATRKSPADFRYLYENHENFSLVPVFYVTFGPAACMNSSLIAESAPSIQIDPSRILHGEQFLEIHGKLPTEGTVESRFKVQDVLDKGSGAVILVIYETFDVETGEKISTAQMSAFAVGAGGFGGPRNSKYIIPTVDPPKRTPDFSVSQTTSTDQAALYRLSGDYNPLHMDDELAKMSGFREPILHGLCSLGFSTRHILQTFADGDSSLFKSIKVRFAKPVIPGQTLRTDMWRQGDRIHFETSVVENNAKVISGAYVDLKEVKMPSSIIKNPCSATKILDSDAVFDQMNEYVKTHPDQVKKINGVFQYVITVNGEPQSYWTLDLKKPKVYKGKSEDKVDTTLTIDDKDMIQLALGKMNPQVAFMRGKLKIKGNIMLTQKLKALLDANRPKL